MIITERNELVLTRQDYIDQLADLKGELAVAKQVGNNYAISSILKDILICNKYIN
jgi:hypothetical protein